MSTDLRETSNINWKNLFYFMSYCMSELKPFEKQCISHEDYKSLYDLQATILNIAVSQVRRFGVMQAYTTQEIITSNPKGRIDFNKTVRSGRIARGQYVCDVPKVTMDTEANQKIKLAMKLMLNNKEQLSDHTLKILKGHLDYFKEVSDITVRDRSLNSKYQVRHYYRPAMTISQYIIRNKIVSDQRKEDEGYGPNKNTSLDLLWEEFLRNFIKEYITERIPEYTVVKKSIDLTPTRRGTPDIIISKDTDDSLLVILDAKWYEDPRITKGIWNQLHAYATQTGIQIKNKETKVSAVFAYHKDYTIQSEPVETPFGFKYTMYGYVININNDFDQIKQDIQKMVDEQLELSETA